MQEFAVPGIYNHRGMNITGFKLVQKALAADNFLRAWKEHDKESWRGNDPEKIPVSIKSDFLM